MFNCIRVYKNGDQVAKTFFTTQEKEDWVNYNKVFRFGNGLLVNGKCIYSGYLTNQEVLTLESNFLKKRDLYENE